MAWDEKKRREVQRKKGRGCGAEIRGSRQDKIQDKTVTSQDERELQSEDKVVASQDKRVTSGS